MKAYWNICRSVATLLLVLCALSAQAGQHWGWMTGLRNFADTGSYGTLGAEAASNRPPPRYSALSWTDSQDNLWMFGGIRRGSPLAVQSSDLWKYNTQTNQWTWVGGPQATAQFGTYTALGANASNWPGARAYSMTWTDSSNRLWFFGGRGLAASGQESEHNDLWYYDTATGIWSWVGGSQTPMSNGSYGTLNVPAASNWPSARRGSAQWLALDGRLWLFGGTRPAYLGSGINTSLSDLWCFDTTTSNWTWKGGPSSHSQPAVYGTYQTEAAANIPEPRWGSTYWTDHQGYFWLFSGWSINNILWRYNPATGMWAWMAGTQDYNSAHSVAGPQGVPTQGASPGLRQNAQSWVDKLGRLWFYGGNGFGATGNYDQADLWRYDTTTNLWAWIGGPLDASSDSWQAAVAGPAGTFAASYTPGIRESSCTWSDSQGRFWLFAGYSSYSNDMWRLDVDTQPPASQAYAIGDTTRAGSAVLQIGFQSSDNTTGTGVAATHLLVKEPGAASFAQTGLSLPGTTGAFAYAPGTASGRYTFAVRAYDGLGGNWETTPTLSDVVYRYNPTVNSAFTETLTSAGAELVFPMTNDLDVTMSLAATAEPGTSVTISRDLLTSYPVDFGHPEHLLAESLNIECTPSGGTPYPATLDWAYDAQNTSITPDRAWSFANGVQNGNYSIDNSNGTIRIPNVAHFSTWYAGTTAAVPVSVSAFVVE